MDSKHFIGVIEGFFGKSWTWPARKDFLSFAKKYNYQFYIYAPKDDSFLRRSWKEPWPEEQFQKIKELREAFREAGILFGIGLSPFEIHFEYNQSGIKQEFINKIEYLNQLQPDVLAILFDDMKGDFPNLAKTQIEILHKTKEISTAKHLIMCPTYYSFDPILEKVFGKQPEGYLENLGEMLDPEIQIFWTGEKVCSKDYSTKHLQTVSQILKRKPFLWDNYPVNDGSKMSKFLHLTEFQSRKKTSLEIAGCAVNPMNQAYLSQIPMATLTTNNKSWLEITKDQLGEKLANEVSKDKQKFEEYGLDQISEEEKTALIKKYTTYSHPVAQEIADWLSGNYNFSPECLTN
ncbi:MAG: hyaluronoglucosaminidase [bacterium]|jgi:hyaluronoglucosaminidase